MEVDTFMLLRRWKLLRRMWHCRWAWTQNIKQLMEFYLTMRNRPTDNQPQQTQETDHNNDRPEPNRKRSLLPGPVNILIQHVEGLGGSWEPGWRPKFRGEVSYDLMRAPINWVKDWLKGIGLRHTIKQAVKRRCTMKGADSFDNNLHHLLNKKRSATSGAVNDTHRRLVDGQDPTPGGLLRK